MSNRRYGWLNIHDTHIGVWEDTEEHNRDQIFRDMERIFGELVACMKERGFEIQRDLIYQSCGVVGKRGDLEFDAHVGGRMFQIEFFQNVCIENPNGGRFDYRKIRRMAAVSQQLRLECITEMWRVVRWLTELGYHISEKDGFGSKRLDPSLLTVRDLAEGRRTETALEKFNRSWGSDRFERGPDGWPSPKETRSWSHGMQQGQVLYARVNGRLVRGQAHDGINGQWQLIANNETVAWNGRFFDCDHPDREPRRYFSDLEDRMRKRIDKAFKEKDYRNVATLSAALDRQLEDRERIAAQ